MALSELSKEKADAIRKDITFLNLDNKSPKQVARALKKINQKYNIKLTYGEE